MKCKDIDYEKLRDITTNRTGDKIEKTHYYMVTNSKEKVFILPTTNIFKDAFYGDKAFVKGFKRITECDKTSADKFNKIVDAIKENNIPVSKDKKHYEADIFIKRTIDPKWVLFLTDIHRYLDENEVMIDNMDNDLGILLKTKHLTMMILD